MAVHHLRIAAELSPASYVNLMEQYRPAGKVGGGRFPELDRRLPSAVYREAHAYAAELGLRLDEVTTHASVDLGQFRGPVWDKHSWSSPVTTAPLVRHA